MLNNKKKVVRGTGLSKWKSEELSAAVCAVMMIACVSLPFDFLPYLLVDTQFTL